MYCPRCSKEHSLPNPNQYCSGCGFYLAEIVESFENDGKIQRVIDSDFPSTRKQVFSGMGLMVFGLVFLILSLIIGTPEPSYFVQFNILIGVLASILGVGFITHSLLPRKQKQVFIPKKESIAGTESNSLPSGEKFTAAEDYVPPVSRSNEEYASAKGSAVEHTTRKLKIDDKS